MRVSVSSSKVGNPAGTICYWHRRVFVVRSHITAGTICYGHRRVSVVRSHIQGARFVTGIVST